MIRVGVYGGSGYAGGELVRYLLGHPEVHVEFVTSRSNAGRPVGQVLPNVASFTDCVFQDPKDVTVRSVDAVFLALAHNASQEFVPALLDQHPDLRIVDLAGDFRSPDPEGYERYYGVKHKAPDLIHRFVYGFTEAVRDRIRGAQLVANPGCFATALLLGLWPLRAAGTLSGPIVVSAITGSSGAGIGLKPTTHHPHRAANVFAYKIMRHQHCLEVEHFLGRTGWRLHFIPHAGPFARGILATMVFPGVPAARLGAIFEEAYDGAPFVGVVKGSPELRLVQNTPFSVVGWDGTDEAACAVTAIDNLAKGAATQALQNLNLMFDLDEKTGIWHPGGFV